MENSRDKVIQEKIDKYAQGALTDQEIQQLWVEFAKNPELLDDLEMEVGLREIFKKKAAGSKKAKIQKLPGWVWHASAAATILLVALVQLFRVESPTDINQFKISNIPYDQLEMAEGMRSEGAFINKADSLLNVGFVAMSEGNQKQALQIFNEVISSFEEEPYASKAYLNKGIIQYNDGRYEDAAASFEEAAQRGADNTMIAEKALWFLGNAYLNIGEHEKALNSIGKAYQKDGVFRKPAFLLYQKLNYDLGNVDFEEEPPTLKDN